MKTAIKLAIPFMLVGLAACADFPANTTYLEELKTTTPTGSAFAQDLAGEYKAFAQSEADQYDWPVSQIFAKKGLAAAHGTVVPPENVDDWAYDDQAARADLVAAHARLLAILATNAPTRAPALTATAQVKFDCWVEQQDEGWQAGDIAACRKDFMTAMDQLEQQMMKKAEAPAPAPAAPAPAMAAPTNYMVFFDFDKSNLSAEARKIIATAAQTIKAGHDAKLKVTGYTDTVGTIQYNLKLSYRRADAVDRELVKDGIPAGNIMIEGKGKTDLLVPTGDGVREPRNRRAVIEFTAQ